MTATDELRRLLDERGVEWHDTKIGKGFITVYEYDGITWIATEHSSGRLSIKGCVKPAQGHYDGMTPEQVIAATLGLGTCHDMGGCRWFRCSACGFGIEDMYVNDEDEYPPEDQPRYCPNCGRKVVDR